MTDTKWTPGPWSWTRIYSLLRYGRKHCGDWDEDDNREIWGTEYAEGWKPDQDDAHLIAAAPELYEALDTLCAVVGLTAFKYEGQRAILQHAMDGASAILAKARGEA